LKIENNRSHKKAQARSNASILAAGRVCEGIRKFPQPVKMKYGISVMIATGCYSDFSICHFVNQAMLFVDSSAPKPFQFIFQRFRFA